MAAFGSRIANLSVRHWATCTYYTRRLPVPVVGMQMHARFNATFSHRRRCASESPTWEAMCESIDRDGGRNRALPPFHDVCDLPSALRKGAQPSSLSSRTAVMSDALTSIKRISAPLIINLRRTARCKSFCRPASSRSCPSCSKRSWADADSRPRTTITFGKNTPGSPPSSTVNSNCRSARIMSFLTCEAFSNPQVTTKLWKKMQRA